MKHYSATFADGTVLHRSSASRTYTHAWRVGRGHGFAGSFELAEKAARADASRYRSDHAIEIVAVDDMLKRHRKATNKAEGHTNG
jgi:hypothetical protein